MATDISTLALRVESLEVEAATGRLKKLSTEGAKTEGVMNILTKAATGLAVALGASKMLEFAKDAVIAASRYETIGVVMENVGKNAGYSRREMEEYAKGLQNSGIAMIESREVLTKLTQAQIDLSKSSDLARVAQDAAVIGNINSSEAFERMVNGIRSGEIEILKGIGLAFSFEAAYKKFADTNNIVGRSLTEIEKTQARANGALEAGARIAGTYAAAMDTPGKQLLSMTRYIKDFIVQVGTPFLPEFGMAIKGVTGFIKDMNNALSSSTGVAVFSAMKDTVGLATDAVQVLAPELVGLATLIGACTAAQLLLNSAILKNPFMWAVLALTTLNEWLKSVDLNLGSLTRKFKEAYDAVKKFYDYAAGNISTKDDHVITDFEKKGMAIKKLMDQKKEIENPKWYNFSLFDSGGKEARILELQTEINAKVKENVEGLQRGLDIKQATVNAENKNYVLAKEAGELSEKEKEKAEAAAQYNESLKDIRGNLLPLIEEQKKYKEQIATIDKAVAAKDMSPEDGITARANAYAALSTTKDALKAASEAASEASKGETKSLADLKNEIKSYSNAAAAALQIHSEWNASASTAADAMRGLQEQYATLDMDPMAKRQYEQNKAFEEGAKAINEYNKKLADLGPKQAEAIKLYAEQEKKLAEFATKLKANPKLENDEYESNYVHALTLDHENLRKELDKYGVTALLVKEIEAGRITTMDQLSDAIYRSTSAIEANKEAAIAAGEESKSFMDNFKAGAAKFAEESKNMGASISNSVSDGFKKATDALTDFVMTGKLKFADFATSVIREMVRMQIQQNIVGPMVGFLGTLIGGMMGGSGVIAPYTPGSGGQTLGSVALKAEGDVMSGPGISAYSNTVLTKPTAFAFAKGIGIAGEDGDEAIMPLTRNKSGTLVGDAKGFGGKATVIVQVIESAEKAGTQKKHTDSGSGVDIIEVFVARIKSEVWGDVANGQGEGPDTLANVYGLNRVAGAY